jgi:hypothetical protein
MNRLFWKNLILVAQPGRALLTSGTVLDILYHEKFAMRLMIAGFINLMISVILVAIIIC